ncbi:MAG: hypothetical protein ACLQFR_24150 [Streptosporangiaceae bacterium]
MPEHMRYASRRRDDRLARVRKLSLWITGGAAAASLGLGTAFAHELPGHASAATSSTARSGATVSGSQRIVGGPSQPGTGHPGSAHGGTSRAGTGTAATGKSGSRRHPPALAKPAQAPQPASNPAAPPVVSSGGS